MSPGRGDDMSDRQPGSVEEAGYVFVDPAAYADEDYFHRACAKLRAADPVHLVEGPGFNPFYAITKSADIFDIDGVPEEERERILEPFTRLDRSRDRQTGGHGLGLAIVRRILELHSGSVQVRASDLGGACIRLEWPNGGE